MPGRGAADLLRRVGDGVDSVSTLIVEAVGLQPSGVPSPRHGWVRAWDEQGAKTGVPKGWRAVVGGRS